jgi:hypothetical protein
VNAYVFEAELVKEPDGTEWRVRLRLDELRQVADETTAVVEVRGKAPPQYPIPDEEELGAGD